MGKDSLPLLYNDGKLKYIRVQDWYNDLLSSKASYAQCFIVSFTRVKNLGSKYMHEYVQFIVEDRSSGDRMRVYAERMNEQDVDMVSIGRDEKEPRKWDELPLPLTSMSWSEKKDQPGLLDVAKILNSTSVVGGGYNFYDKNCFWFAFTTFDVVQLAFKGTLKTWSWINSGGTGGGGVKDMWGLGFPTMFKVFFKSTADKFETERENNMNWLAPSETRNEVTPTAFVEAVQSTVLSPEFSNTYVQWANQFQIKLDQGDLKAIALRTMEHIGQMEKDGSIQWTAEFDNSVVDLTEKTGNDLEADKYLSAYETILPSEAVNSTPGGRAVNVSEIQSTEYVDDLGSKKQDYEGLARGLKILAGKILIDAGLE